MAVSPIQAGKQFLLVVKNFVQSRLVNSKVQVQCAATVVCEEALGEDIEQLLQPIVSYSVQYNQQNNRTFYIPTHFQSLRGGETMEGGASDII